MLDSGFYNMDCMEGMKQFPDKFFDLAIVDPPYGNAINPSTNNLRGGSRLETARKIRRAVLPLRFVGLFSRYDLSDGRELVEEIPERGYL